MNSLLDFVGNAGNDLLELIRDFLYDVISIILPASVLFITTLILFNNEISVIWTNSSAYGFYKSQQGWVILILLSFLYIAGYLINMVSIFILQDRAMKNKKNYVGLKPESYEGIIKRTAIRISLDSDSMEWANFVTYIECVARNLGIKSLAYKYQIKYNLFRLLSIILAIIAVEWITTSIIYRRPFYLIIIVSIAIIVFTFLSYSLFLRYLRFYGNAIVASAVILDADLKNNKDFFKN